MAKFTLKLMTYYCDGREVIKWKGDFSTREDAESYAESHREMEREGDGYSGTVWELEYEDFIPAHYETVTERV